MSGRPGTPLTRARSEWVPSEDIAGETLSVLLRAGATNLGVWTRQVHDGALRAIRTCDPPEMRWHLSVSHTIRGTRAPRYPTWDELADARYTLLPDDIDVVMHLPPPSEYVAVHDTTFHLHEYRGE